jgi:hypothetical protein
LEVVLTPPEAAVPPRLPVGDAPVPEPEGVLEPDPVSEPPRLVEEVSPTVPESNFFLSPAGAQVRAVRVVLAGVPCGTQKPSYVTQCQLFMSFSLAVTVKVCVVHPPSIELRRVG